MATVNIGNLSFTHKGDYASGTAYVKNDVVYYATNGNAYIAKQATTGNVPTNGTYWSQFAQGSGGIWNAGLSLGSAGQSVKVNAAGNALEFGTISSELVKLKTTSVTSTTATVDFDFTGVDDSVYHKYIFHLYARFDTAACIRCRIRQSGSTISTSHYNYALDYAYRNLSGNSNHNATGMSENGDHWRFHDWSAATGNYEMSSFELVKPQSTTNYKFVSGNGAIAVHNGNQYHPSGHSFSNYFHGNSNAWTGFHFYPSSGNFEDFEVVMHGLKK